MKLLENFLLSLLESFFFIAGGTLQDLQGSLLGINFLIPSRISPKSLQRYLQQLFRGILHEFLQRLLLGFLLEFRERFVKKFLQKSLLEFFEGFRLEFLEIFFPWNFLKNSSKDNCKSFFKNS